MQNIISILQSLFQYYIVSFLPNGEAYTHVDSYQGGFFMWICAISCFISIITLKLLGTTKRKIASRKYSISLKLTFLLRTITYIVRKRKIPALKISYRNYMRRITQAEANAERLTNERLLLNQSNDKKLNEMLEIVDKIESKRGYVQ